MTQAVLDRPNVDFEAARQRMVDAQIRPAQINDPRIVAAMRNIPREECVPAALRDFAYADRSLPLGEGRVLTEPRVIARLLQSSKPQEGEKVLIVAGGTGYAAAILAELGLDVSAIEDREDLAAIGHTFTKNNASTVTWYSGSVTGGTSFGDRFDLIVIDGAVEEIPEPLRAHLGKQGRVAGVIKEGDGVPSAFIAHDEGGAWKISLQFDAAVPVLPEFASIPAFAL